MKSIPRELFAAQRSAEAANPQVGFHRASAAELSLRESWFRDAIFECPELVIGPCREAGRLLPDETWLPWQKEFSLDAGSVDVLLVSSRGRLAVVETKLSYNPERRREVVAQVLDYALALQELPGDELPPLPTHECRPELADLHECLSRGRFLLIVAGDSLDPRAVRLSEGLLTGHLTSEWDLAMVDLNLYRPSAGQGPLLLVPELRGMVVSETRQVVRVQVEGTNPKATVTVERIPPGDDVSDPTKPKLKSIPEFLALVQRQTPASHDAIGRIVEKLRKTADERSDRFAFGLQAASANFYWKPLEGKPRRIFAMGDTGRFRIWLHYVLSYGRVDLAAIIRDASTSLVVIPPDATSGFVLVAGSNVDQILAVIDAVVDAVGQQKA